MKGISIDKQMIQYYGNTAGYIAKDTAVIDPLFQNERLERFLKKQGYKTHYEEGTYDRLMAGSKPGEEINIKRPCRIWQLKPEVAAEKKFIEYNQFLKGYGSPSLQEYQMVFDGRVETNDLEELFDQFSQYHETEGYNGHPLSVSDVIELYDHGGSEFHYVDRFGFQELPAFQN